MYGHITEITSSGRIKGHTSMMLRFDRLVMPDGRRAAIHAEIIELYHAPSGEKVMWKALLSPAAAAEQALYIRPSGRVPAPCWVESLAEAKAPESVRSSVARADWGQPPSTDARRSRCRAVRRC